MNYLQKYLFLLLFCSMSAMASFAQDTLWNQTDDKGQKQGFWKVTYENGIVKYQGFFKNSKPFGEFKRYHEDGTIKALQQFMPDGITTYVKMFYNNGILAADGKFVNSQKDSVWNYYSFYDKGLKLKETYSLGKKNGISKKYHSSGKLAEELNWKNNQKDGSWIQYFEDGSLLLKTNYISDKRQGNYETYYRGNKLETKGVFVNNLMEGEWIYFDDSGKEKMRIIYNKGIPQNAGLLEKEQEDFFHKLENNKGKIPEPDENNFMP